MWAVARGKRGPRILWGTQGKLGRLVKPELLGARLAPVAPLARLGPLRRAAQELLGHPVRLGWRAPLGLLERPEWRVRLEPHRRGVPVARPARLGSLEGLGLQVRLVRPEPRAQAVQPGPLELVARLVRLGPLARVARPEPLP